MIDSTDNAICSQTRMNSLNLCYLQFISHQERDWIVIVDNMLPSDTIPRLQNCIRLID